jgi:type IV pilus assembly protein PilF
VLGSGVALRNQICSALLAFFLSAFSMFAQSTSSAPPKPDSPTRATTATNEGLAALQRGDYPAARKQFETAIRLNPASAEAHNYLGWVLYTTGEIKPAITQFETAIRLKPSLAEPT